MVKTSFLALYTAWTRVNKVAKASLSKRPSTGPGAKNRLQWDRQERPSNEGDRLVPFLRSQEGSYSNRPNIGRDLQSRRVGFWGSRPGRSRPPRSPYPSIFRSHGIKKMMSGFYQGVFHRFTLVRNMALFSEKRAIL